MGYYTNFKINARIKEGTHEEICQLLTLLTNYGKGSWDASREFVKDQQLAGNKYFSHVLFSCDRWWGMFDNFTGDKDAEKSFKDLHLRVSSFFKNYGLEAMKFVDFIMPFVDHEFANTVFSTQGEDQDDVRDISTDDAFRPYV